jgi:hypothetical protein
VIVAGCVSRIVLYYLALQSFGFEAHDECYSRHVRTKLDICWWTNSSRSYHPLSSQCFGADMVYLIYLLLTLTVTK